MYVLMVVPSDFPNGDAGAVRDMAFANIFKALGYEIFVIGAGKNKKEGVVDGIHFFSVYRPAQSRIGHLKRFIFSKKVYMSFIKQIKEQYGQPSIIYINDVPHSLIRKLRNEAEKNNILMLHDSTEWYSPCEFAHGKLDKQYILKDNLNRRIIKNPIKVICISSYLTAHFRSRGLHAVRIPVIMDVENARTSLNTDEKIKFIYAGSPANKDYLKEIVLGTALLLKEAQKRIELHILGADEDQIKTLTKLQNLPLCIKAYGRVPREQVEEIMIGMDFAVLLRPSEERYAKAGFPTKSVEAMAHGVAMLCNNSSDLGMYLKDDENAIIVEGHDEHSFVKGLERVLSLSREQIDTIKTNARKLAEKEFDYRIWIDTVSRLIGEK